VSRSNSQMRRIRDIAYLDRDRLDRGTPHYVRPNADGAC
jgi:hypothetical protein